MKVPSPFAGRSHYPYAKSITIPLGILLFAAIPFTGYGAWLFWGLLQVEGGVGKAFWLMAGFLVVAGVASWLNYWAVGLEGRMTAFEETIFNLRWAITLVLVAAAAVLFTLGMVTRSGEAAFGFLSIVSSIACLGFAIGALMWARGWKSPAAPVTVA